MQTQESFNRNLIISYKNLIGDVIYKSYKKLIRRPSANTLSVDNKTTTYKTLIGFFSTHRWNTINIIFNLDKKDTVKIILSLCFRG